MGEKNFSEQSEQGQGGGDGFLPTNNGLRDQMDSTVMVCMLGRESGGPHILWSLPGKARWDRMSPGHWLVCFRA